MTTALKIGDKVQRRVASPVPWNCGYVAEVLYDPDCVRMVVLRVDIENERAGVWVDCRLIEKNGEGTKL